MRARGAVVTMILVSLLAFGLDFARPPADQLSAKILLTAIDLYQATVSRALGRAGARCRFEPSCSRYGEAVIRKYGTLRGSWMAIKRIARCGPWTETGTTDPPP